VVWLSRYGLWAVARYQEVHAVLNDWRTFCSGRGVGMADFAKEKPWRPPSLVLGFWHQGKLYRQTQIRNLQPA
jgi:hypothetical protein